MTRLQTDRTLYRPTEHFTDRQNNILRMGYQRSLLQLLAHVSENRINRCLKNVSDRFYLRMQELFFLIFGCFYNICKNKGKACYAGFLVSLFIMNE